MTLTEILKDQIIHSYPKSNVTNSNLEVIGMDIDIDSRIYLTHDSGIILNFKAEESITKEIINL